MSVIPYARALPGAIAFKDNDNVSQTYKGEILTHDGTAHAIIKDIPGIELANELLAALLGQKLGLPIPQCYLTLVDKGVMQTEYALKTTNGKSLVFSSKDVSIPNTAVKILASAQNDKKNITLKDIQSTATFKAMASSLIQWDKLGDLYAFDSWVANVDRHMGNILWGGQDKIWLIDHGHCFSGPDWSPNNLDATNVYSNKLANWLTPSMSDTQRKKTSSAVSKIAGTISSENITQSVENSRISEFLPGTYISALEDFLNLRKSETQNFSDIALNVSGLI